MVVEKIPKELKLKMTEVDLRNLFPCFLAGNFKIIHKSLWAISIKVNDEFFKIFYYLEYDKIKKENDLLNLINHCGSELFFNKDYEFYYSKMQFLKFDIITKFTNKEWITRQIEDIKCKFLRIKASLPNFSLVKEYICKKIMLCRNDYDVNASIKFISNLKEQHFVHGDFTIDNVMIYGSCLYVLDFENACLGPLQWDETSFVYSLLEKRYYELAVYFIKEFNIDCVLIKSFALYKLGLALSKKTNIEMRRAVLKYLSDLNIGEK